MKGPLHLREITQRQAVTQEPRWCKSVACTWRPRLNDAYFVGHNPDFQLLKPLLKPLLELNEKLSVLRRVLYIRDDSHIGLLVMRLLMGPFAVNRLRNKGKHPFMSIMIE